MAATVEKKRSKVSFSEEIDKTVNPNPVVEVAPVPEAPAEEKNKGGRPSSGEVKRISLAIPVDLCETVDLGAELFFKGNKTAYINSLIKKDQEENFAKYKSFQELKNGLN